MHVAVGLPQLGGDVASCVRAAREAEEAGAWGVWCFDNLAPLKGPAKPILDGWTLLPVLARSTTSVRIASLATRAGLRHPALVPRMAAVVQAASNGRLVVGVGAGDKESRAEEAAFGIDRPDVFEQTVKALKEDPHPVRPDGSPPVVWVAGRSHRLVSFAARHADGWHGWGLGADAFAERAAAAREVAGPDFPCWWGGYFKAAEADRHVRELAAAGASGITWMVRSTDEAAGRPALLKAIQSLNS